jgi:hypothetical protein
MRVQNKPRSIGPWFGLGAVLIVIAFIAVSAYAMNGHPVSIASLSSVTTTSTKNDVKDLLGKPTKISEAGANVAWVYADFTWCTITVVFGPDGKVVSVEHDH